MAPLLRPTLVLAAALLAVVASGSVVLGGAGGVRPMDPVRGGRVQPTDQPAAGMAAKHSAGPIASQHPSACIYGYTPSPTPVPMPKQTPVSKGSASAASTIRVTGVLSAEGWVPPAGQTCPPEP